MTKKQVIFTITTLTLLPLSFITSVAVWFNLKAHSVYYAKHIPHKEAENPELVFIVENLFFIPKTNDINFYDALSHKIYKENDYELGRNFYYPGKGYALFMFKNGSFVWDEQGRFDYYSTFYEAETHLRTEKHKALAEQELHAIIDPIIELQGEPTLNLQWLFNWVHRERFNK